MSFAAPMVTSASMPRPQRRHTHNGPSVVAPLPPTTTGALPPQAADSPHQPAQLSPAPFGSRSLAASPHLAPAAHTTPAATTAAAAAAPAAAYGADGYAPIHPAPMRTPAMGAFHPPARPHSQPRSTSGTGTAAAATLLEPAPIKKTPRPKADRPAKKPRPSPPDEPMYLTQPLHELLLPHTVDDGQKPTLSYAQLIAAAISQSPQGRLTLAQIYKWITTTYRYYSSQAENGTGWQNSIRHNLSLHHCFEKVERPKDDPGKGHYWTILPGTEGQLLKDKPAARKASDGGSISVLQKKARSNSASSGGSAVTPAPAPATLAQPASSGMVAPAPAAALRATTPQPPRPTSSQSLPALPSSADPSPLFDQVASSEATIAVSDAMESSRLFNEATNAHDTTLDTTMQFSPHASVGSSPPVARKTGRATTPQPPFARKRTYSSLEDSGYGSSLESSAARPGQALEDRPRTKRRSTRAEDEISRMRSTAVGESPSGSLPRGAPMSPPPRSRGSQVGLMGPPLTPVVKPPPARRLPPAQSPNTTLKMHREHVNSLLRPSYPTTDDEMPPYSPAFNLDHCTRGDIEIREDSPQAKKWVILGLGFPANGSPVRKVDRRTPVMQRTQSASALADITGFASNRVFSDAPSTPLGYTPSKFLRFDSSPPKAPAPALATPTRATVRLQTANDGQFSSPDVALDVLAGFASIGDVAARARGRLDRTFSGPP
jgi:hypothetical protein